MNKLICVFIMFTLCLSGCGVKKEKWEKTLLKYSLFSEPHFAQLEKEVIKDFEAENPDIKVDMTVSSYRGHNEKIQAQLVGGTAPDIWLTDGVFIMEWAERGVIEDLTELFNLNMKAEDYFGFNALKDPDGRLWGIPKEIQTFGLFYNRDIFDRYKITYPDDSWTWNDLLKAARALTKDENGDGRVDIYGLNSGSSFIANMIYQNGGTILDEKRRNSLLNSHVAREAIEFGFLFYKEKVVPTPEASSSIGGVFEMFREGRLSMFLGQYCYATTLKNTKPTFNYSVVLPPKNVRRACYYDPNALVITRGRPAVVKEAAWKYIQYHSGLEVQKKLGMDGEGLPFHREAAVYVVNTDYAKEHSLKVFMDMVDESVDYDVNGCWRMWRSAFDREIEKGYTGIVPVETVPDNLHGAVQKVLDEHYSNKKE